MERGCFEINFKVKETKNRKRVHLLLVEREESLNSELKSFKVPGPRGLESLQLLRMRNLRINVYLTLR